jgi:hypothetical protein
MAPNSLIALAQHNIDPTTILLKARGIDIRKKVLIVPDPSVLATFSIRGSTLSKPSLAEFTTKDELTKSMAIIIPGIALVKTIPNLPNGAPNIPPEVNTSNSAIPLTVCGITMGISIIDSTNPFPKKSCLAKIKANGTPNRTAIRVAANAEYTLINMDEITWLSFKLAIIELRSEDNIKLTIGIRINKTRKDPIKAKNIVV